MACAVAKKMISSALDQKNAQVLLLAWQCVDWMIDWDGLLIARRSIGAVWLQREFTNRFLASDVVKMDDVEKVRLFFFCKDHQFINS